MSADVKRIEAVAELTERHREILASGAILAGSVDRDGRPDIARVWGVKAHEDGRTLRVLLAAPWSKKFVANLQDRGWIALTFTDPATYQSYQAKGRAQRIETPTEEDRALAAQHHTQFDRLALRIGVHMCPVEYTHVPAVAITFFAEHLFCQTPGPGAGAPVGGTP
jgi:hypothetical protein